MDILKRLKLLKSTTLHSRLFQAVTTLSLKVFTNIQTRITWVYLNSDISVNRTDQCPYVTYLNVSRVACSSSISSRSLVAVRRDLQELTHHRLVLARLRQRHWRNFTLKSCGDQWRRQDFVSAGHDDRGAEGASIEVPKTPSGWGMGRGVRSPADYGVWGSVMSSPSMVRAKPRPLSHFLHILGHRTLPTARKILWNLELLEKLQLPLWKSGGDSHHHVQKWWWKVTIVTYKVAPTDNDHQIASSLNKFSSVNTVLTLCFQALAPSLFPVFT